MVPSFQKVVAVEAESQFSTFSLFLNRVPRMRIGVGRFTMTPNLMTPAQAAVSSQYYRQWDLDWRLDTSSSVTQRLPVYFPPEHLELIRPEILPLPASEVPRSLVGCRKPSAEQAAPGRRLIS